MIHFWKVSLLPYHGMTSYGIAGLKICGILVANATMFSHLLPGCSCGSKHLLSAINACYCYFMACIFV